MKPLFLNLGRGGEIGIRSGLKIRRPQGLGGSRPPPGTTFHIDTPEPLGPSAFCTTESVEKGEGRSMERQKRYAESQA